MNTPPVCDYEGSDYQDKFWEHGGRAYEDAVEEIALKRLLSDKGNLLLELGAGAGRNTTRYKGFDTVVLVDYSVTQLQQAQEKLSAVDMNCKFVAANIYNLPFVEGLFDAATMIRTLHHMSEPATALNQVRQVLKENGVFLLEYANKKNIKAIIRYLLRRQRWNPFTPEPVEFAALNYDFHPSTVKSWLQQCGFTIERQLTVSHFRIGWMKKNLPLDFLVWLDSIAQLTGNLWQLSPSVFTRSHAVGKTETAGENSFFFCPNCRQSELPDQAPEIICPACGKKFPVIDGIYDFRCLEE